MQKYSVLMAVYLKDNPEYLKMAIESMLNQTIKPDQYVIVMDGAVTKNLNKIIEDSVNENPGMFTIAKLIENKGLANALNIGLKFCRNDLVARMDADDISLPERCERELALFDLYPELVACGCNIDEFYDEIKNTKTSRVVPTEYEEIRKFSRKRQPFNHPTVMYKKSIVESLGGYSKLKRKEDFDLFSRIITSGYYVRNIGESLYLYRADKSNYLRRKSKENLQSALYVYKLHWKRKGCSIVDYFEICLAEVIFFVLPMKIMKMLSDLFLRKHQV